MEKEMETERKKEPLLDTRVFRCRQYNVNGKSREKKICIARDFIVVYSIKDVDKKKKCKANRLFNAF